MAQRPSDNLRKVLRDLVPPVAWRALRRWGRVDMRLEEGVGGWPGAVAASAGYADAAILERVATATRAVMQGEAVAERDGIVLSRDERSWPVLAGLLWTAAERGGRLDVLDFGGSLGSIYFQNRRFLATLDVRWAVVDLPHVVVRGRADIEDERLCFFETIAEATTTFPADVVLLGSSIQYIEHPYRLLEQLAALPHRRVIFDRTPFTPGETDHVVVQHVPPSIYPASFPSHVFGQARFIRTLEALGWRDPVWFDSLSGDVRGSSGLQVTYRGLIASRC